MDKVVLGRFRRKRVYERAHRACRRDPRSFSSDAELLEEGADLIALKAALDEEEDLEPAREARSLERRLRTHLFRRIALSSRNTVFADAVNTCRLGRSEQEILLLLCLSGLGMVRKVYDIEDVQMRLHAGGNASLAVVKALSAGGPLDAAGLIRLEPDETPVNSSVSASPELLSLLVQGKKAAGSQWKSKSYNDLLLRCKPIVLLQEKKVADMERHVPSFPPRESEIRALTGRISRSIRSLEAYLRRCRRWPLRELFGLPVGEREREIVIALLGKELGFIKPDAELCMGAGLAKCISRDAGEAHTGIACLRRNAPLRTLGVIRVCKGRAGNVLLQELERHAGLCILATNRALACDPALERRIAVKVEFQSPDRRQARKIWRKLVPRKLPLARDVDFERLASTGLTGGAIKNTIMNAARLALIRGKHARISMADFDKALAMERLGKGGREGGIGFRGSGMDRGGTMEASWPGSSISCMARRN